VRGLKDISHQSLTFSLKKLAAMTRHDAGCILSAMLKHRQCIINIGSDALVRGNSNHTTHFSCS
jgi:hypothetical protein